jgi:hypothetical protein
MMFFTENFFDIRGQPKPQPTITSTLTGSLPVAGMANPPDMVRYLASKVLFDSVSLTSSILKDLPIQSFIK